MLEKLAVTDQNVLRVNRAEEQTLLLEASHETVRRILMEHEATLIEIAERIDVTVQTISNALNKKHVLSALCQTRLAKAYGPHVLDPFAALGGGRMVPLDPSDANDVLPFISRAALRIAEARDAKSKSGARETLQERCNYLPDLRALRRELDVLIQKIEAERDAA
jgi:transcriptional regulator with XRE-family HTH domain